MLRVLAEESLKSVQGNYEKAVNQVVVGNCSEDNFDSLSFHAVAGVRMHRLQRFLGADRTNGYVAVFMAILEPGRALTFWPMQAVEAAVQQQALSDAPRGGKCFAVGGISAVPEWPLEWKPGRGSACVATTWTCVFPPVGPRTP